MKRLGVIIGIVVFSLLSIQMMPKGREITLDEALKMLKEEDQSRKLAGTSKVRLLLMAGSVQDEKIQVVAKTLTDLIVMNPYVQDSEFQFTCFDQPRGTVTAEILTEKDNVFSPECPCLNTSEQTALLNYCTKVDRKKPKGHGDRGLLVVFAHTCPNNSIPLLHKSTRKWEALFRRYA